MVDHVRTLLLNPDGVAGYRKVRDANADTVLARFGVTGSDGDSETAVDRLLPLAMAPDLSNFRAFFDQRITPREPLSPYRQGSGDLSPDGLYAKVLTADGWWDVSGLFQSDDPSAQAVLDDMRAAAVSRDAPYALGAVLLACAYRRFLMQGREA